MTVLGHLPDSTPISAFKVQFVINFFLESLCEGFFKQMFPNSFFCFIYTTFPTYFTSATSTSSTSHASSTFPTSLLYPLHHLHHLHHLHELHLHHMHHLHQRRHISCKTLTVSCTKDLLHKSSYTGTVTKEFLHTSCYTGVDTPESTSR